MSRRQRLIRALGHARRRTFEGSARTASRAPARTGSTRSSGATSTSTTATLRGGNEEIERLTPTDVLFGLRAA